jgi:hypothetical protein
LAPFFIITFLVIVNFLVLSRPILRQSLLATGSATASGLMI